MAVNNIKNSLAEMRDQALAAMLATPQGKAALATEQGITFKALDEALSKISGANAVASANAVVLRRSASWVERLGVGNVGQDGKPKRISQTDYAAMALRKAGEPLPIGRLMEHTIAQGGVIGGADPIANFRSNLSRDDRFVSIMRNGLYFWWFTGEALPLGWANEATEPDLLAQSVASSIYSSQEGGDDHAVNNT